MERTLGSAKVGSTVTVIKIEGDGAYKTSDHGHGNHEGKQDLYKEGCAAWRSCRSYGSRI